MICGVTKKRSFKTENSANVRIKEILSEPSNRKYTPSSFRIYKCEFCGKYHLSSKELSSYWKNK